MRQFPFAAWLAVLTAITFALAGCDLGDSEATTPAPSGGGPGTSSTDTGIIEEKDGSITADNTRLFEVVVQDGLVQGGPKSLRVKRGQEVFLEVVSDVEDEAHLHGIDIETEVGPGKPGVLEFTARDQGSYELELHEAGTVLGAVVVS